MAKGDTYNVDVDRLYFFAGNLWKFQRPLFPESFYFIFAININTYLEY